MQRTTVCNVEMFAKECCQTWYVQLTNLLVLLQSLIQQHRNSVFHKSNGKNDRPSPILQANPQTPGSHPC